MTESPPNSTAVPQRGMWWMYVLVVVSLMATGAGAGQAHAMVSSTSDARSLIDCFQRGRDQPRRARTTTSVTP